MAPKARGSAPDFVFLSYAPDQNRKSQAIQDTQRRAHAARRSHAIARQRRAVVESGSSEEGSASTSPASAKISPPHDNGPQIEDVTHHVHVSDSVDTSTLDCNVRLVITEDEQLQIFSAVRNGPRMPLEQTPMDPFDTFAVKELPRYVYKVLDLAADMKWGHLKPSVLNQRSNPLKRAWLRATMESPSVLHALVYGMLISLESVGSPLEIDQTLSLRHQTHAITLLQRDLYALGNEKPHQNILLALITLAAHGEPSPAQHSLSQIYVGSPLAITQNLHIYGLMKLVPEHIQAVYLILSRLGGIEAVTLYGLRDTLEFCDLYFATRFGSCPRLAYQHPIHPLIPDIEYSPDCIAERLLLRCGRSLVTLTAWNEEYIELIGMMCVLLTGLDQYQRETASAPSLPALVRARTAVQHRLTSIRPVDMLQATPDQRIFEICRITLLIFSNMVFFPLPQTTGVNVRLVTNLRFAINTTIAQPWIHQTDLVTWALMIGGIAAETTKHRRWFVLTFQDKLVWHVEDWDEVQMVLEGYLWWDYTCAHPGRIYWNEVFPQFNEPSLFSGGVTLPHHGLPEDQTISG